MRKVFNGKALLIGLEKLSEVMLDSLPDLKVIGCNTTGTDHLPIEAMSKKDIKLISLRGETEFLRNIPSVAELTIWFILELLRKPHDGRFLGNQLKDKTVGILGLGRIGTHVAERLHAFETTILYNDIKKNMYFVNGVDAFRSLKDLFIESDIVSLHIPLAEKTEGMIEEKHLLMMKPTALVINTSRGQVIKGGAIEKALKEKWIAGYGTDVARDDKELKRFRQLKKDGYNVVLTDHIGGNTQEAIQLTEEFITAKVKAYLKLK